MAACGLANEAEGRGNWQFVGRRDSAERTQRSIFWARKEVDFSATRKELVRESSMKYGHQGSGGDGWGKKIRGEEGDQGEGKLLRSN